MSVVVLREGAAGQRKPEVHKGMNKKPYLVFPSPGFSPCEVGVILLHGAVRENTQRCVRNQPEWHRKLK